MRSRVCAVLLQSHAKTPCRSVLARSYASRMLSARQAEEALEEARKEVERLEGKKQKTGTSKARYIAAVATRLEAPVFPACAPRPCTSATVEGPG